MSREQTEGGTNGDDFEVEGYYYFTVMQGGIKCKSLRAGLINSKDPKHKLFCRETAFFAIYVLFQGYSIPLMIVPIYICRCSIMRTFKKYFL